jgi:hypothetical protein
LLRIASPFEDRIGELDRGLVKGADQFSGVTLCGVWQRANFLRGGGLDHHSSTSSFAQSLWARKAWAGSQSNMMAVFLEVLAALDHDNGARGVFRSHGGSRAVF